MILYRQLEKGLEIEQKVKVMKLNVENVDRVLYGDLDRLVFFYKGREFRLDSQMMFEAEHLVISDSRGRIVYTEMVQVYEAFAKVDSTLSDWTPFLDHHIETYQILVQEVDGPLLDKVTQAVLAVSQDLGKSPQNGDFEMSDVVLKVIDLIEKEVLGS